MLCHIEGINLTEIINHVMNPSIRSHIRVYTLFGATEGGSVAVAGRKSDRWDEAQVTGGLERAVCAMSAHQSLSLSLSIFLVVSVIRPLPVLLYSSPGVDLSSTLSCMYISDTQPQHVHITLHMEGNLLIPCARMLYLSTYDPIPRNF